jgi:hypothetical protein
MDRLRPKSTIYWTINTVEGNNNSNRINKKILEVVEFCNLHQTVTQPTRKDNILDVFLTNRPTLTTRSTTLPGLGDVYMVFIGSSASAKMKRHIHLYMEKCRYRPTKKQMSPISQQLHNN